MLDYLYKFLRKSLSERLYRFLQFRGPGRGREWYRPETYKSIFDIYAKFLAERGWEIRGSAVLEIGCGNQLFTAFHFLAAGASQVLLVDPQLADLDSIFSQNIQQFRAAFPDVHIQEAEAREQIAGFASLEAVPNTCTEALDVSFSHLSLEHFEDLTTFFTENRRLLKPGAFSLNVVDLSDHTYHVFNKNKATRLLPSKRALFHLRYSDRTFQRINDPRTYMNRMLLPVYFQLADKFGFRAELLGKVLYTQGRAKIHADVLAKFAGEASPEELFVTSFRILFVKEDKEDKGSRGSPGHGEQPQVKATIW